MVLYIPFLRIISYSFSYSKEVVLHDKILKQKIIDFPIMTIPHKIG